VFIQPAAGDAGSCLGAAALAHIQLRGAWRNETLRDVYLGPEWSGDEVKALLVEMGIAGVQYRGREEALLEDVAERLRAGEVIGWFQGRMEFGPRALGARSILASPLLVEMRERVNRLVKKRESFRPFAPSVLLEHAPEHFDLPHPSPFMLETCRVTSPLHLPAITHVDGSARPQTVTREANGRYARLIGAFYAKTGCPMLLNTSFNLRGEPIVCTPVDALVCAARAGLDALVIEDVLVPREALPAAWARLLPGWREVAPSHTAVNGSPLGENLYPF
jgi:carbamoyltransferase